MIKKRRVIELKACLGTKAVEEFGTKPDLAEEPTKNIDRNSSQESSLLWVEPEDIARQLTCPRRLVMSFVRALSYPRRLPGYLPLRTYDPRSTMISQEQQTGRGRSSRCCTASLDKQVASPAAVEKAHRSVRSHDFVRRCEVEDPSVL
jgi:hypothetical protein